jgi:poly(ADP-ribose) glycohydrolase ARH3
MIKPLKYTGCFLGLAIGDAYGAPHEGGSVERLLWKLIGKTKSGRMRYTDDTQMSLDLANSFIQNKGIQQEHLARTFAESYSWSRGYGPNAAWLLKKIKNGLNWQDVNRAKYKEGSFGNGAAMRAPILALCYPNTEKKLNKNIVKSSEITHAHSLAIEGAKLIAFVTYAALHDWCTERILKALPIWCYSNKYQSKVAFCIESIQVSDIPPIKELKSKLGNGIAAVDSCVTAIYFALKYRNQSYEMMLAQIFKLGGDTDTMGAMAGAIWGAFNGSDIIDKNMIQYVENSEKIIEISERLYAVSSNQNLELKGESNLHTVDQE